MASSEWVSDVDMCPSVGFIQFSCQEKFGRYKYLGLFLHYKLQSFEYVNICFVDECPAKSIEIIGLGSKV